MKGAAKEPKERPPVSLNGADWRTSDAKKLIVQDMMDNIVPVAPRIRDIQKLFAELYADQPEFADFPFDEQRYKDRINRIQDNVRRVKWARDYDRECLDEARKVFPAQAHGPTGEILWRGSYADACLDEDMANGRHLQMKPSELRETRPCYQEFSKKRFAKRIDQKREAAKPYGCNPMQAAAKREYRERTKVKNRPHLSRAGTTAPYVNTAKNRFSLLM
jgi:hypothetical protein